MDNPKDIRMTPPIHRFSMVYQPKVPKHHFAVKGTVMIISRIVLFALVACSIWFAATTISTVLNSPVPEWLKLSIIAIFSVLFGWISLSFWTSLIGFIMLMMNHTPSITRDILQDDRATIGEGVRIAVIMPVYNEDVARIFAGLQTMYESLRNTGQLHRFDFYVLSDSTKPEQGRQEEAAWKILCENVDGFGKIFYRRRKSRIHKKSGNVADFCRRWGTQYKYMIPLDADSLVSGRLMVDLARVMEARPDVGILQTAPLGINQESLSSRINQFAGYLYGPMLLAGAYFWQRDNASFWGHNAIIRLEPFMKYCALPPGKGSPPFGGEILSHDFVEAALMRRAGWGVWLAYDLNESYEELPPHLLEELARDRRWCRGNIQHLKLMFLGGISFGHRLLFVQGNMFYFSAFLWFWMLVLMSWYAVFDFFNKPDYFPSPHSLFPQWPVHYYSLSKALLIATAVFLFLPKFLSVVWVVVTGRARLFGGAARVTLSVVLEIVFSILLAPIRMLFHTWFVFTSLLGGKLEWKKQTRQLKRISFWEAFLSHWLGSLVALVWAVVAFYINQTMFLWLSVIVLPLIFAMPISMFMSYPEAGRFFRKAGFFMTPMEIEPPPEIARFNSLHSTFLR